MCAKVEWFLLIQQSRIDGDQWAGTLPPCHPAPWFLLSYCSALDHLSVLAHWQMPTLQP